MKYSCINLFSATFKNRHMYFAICCDLCMKLTNLGKSPYGLSDSMSAPQT